MFFLIIYFSSSHVWNECWIRRDDLFTKEQGWQIIDSTPIQMCDGRIENLVLVFFFLILFKGLRRTGPCPVSCIKKGQLGLRWDSPYIHSTINGNKNHWIVYPDGNMELLGLLF